jgi:hypothetical protein
MTTQHWDHPDRVAQRRETLDAISARDGTAARAARADLARQILDEQRGAGREDHTYIPSNFLPPEARRTWTTPAGESACTTPDPRPDARSDATEQRLAWAALAREVGRENMLAGTNTTTFRGFSTEGYGPEISRDASGRLRIDWVKIGESDPG